MTVLRSREVLPPKTLTTHSASSTPSQSPTSMSSRCPSPKQDISRSGYYYVSGTGPPCRRSLRLASKSDPGMILVSRRRAKPTNGSFGKIAVSLMEEAVNDISDLDLVQEAEGERGSDLMAKRAKVSEGIGGSEGLSSTDTDEDLDEDDGIANKGKRRRKKLKVDAASDLSHLVDESGEKFLSLRSGKRVVKGGNGIVIGGDEEEGIGREFERNLRLGHDEHDDIKKELGENLSLSVHEDGDSGKRKRRFSREEKGKGKLVNEDLAPKGLDVGVTQLDSDKSIQGAVHDGPVNVRWSREEKGKAKMDDDADTKGASEISGDNTVANDIQVDGEAINAEVKETRAREYKNRFRAIARRNASRFAHYNIQEEEYHLPQEVVKPPLNEMEPAIEDWPGPFSTAMKIIKDRANNMNNPLQKSYSRYDKKASVIWVPKNNKGCERKLVPPSLKELCLEVLVDNADAIASLEHVPDVLRHKLSLKLCSSRKMNGDVFSLFFLGSPTEVRIRDCSWLTEEQFTKSFQGCDTRNLTVLRLDQCGRCMPDYILCSTLAQSSSSLPALTTLSLSGACRLSDIGLSAIVSSAPALTSINLNQCSLLTSAGINILADKLGHVLRELYINDCQSIDAMLILPSLKRLEHLKVLSLAGIQTVCDDFVKEFVTVLGHNIKELVLADCVKLTDSSMKVISESCPGLCSLDLVDLCKLTDSTMGYLANGCRAIQTLKLRRNNFSDEAIAAFLEFSGELLQELSLNNVKKVGQLTALSLARCSRNLLSLDVSWCRNLSDEAMGLIVDSCLSLKMLKLFGCTQITNVFLDGHSNPEVQIIGLKMHPFLKEVKLPCYQEGLLYNSLVSSSI